MDGRKRDRQIWVFRKVEQAQTIGRKELAAGRWGPGVFWGTDTTPPAWLQCRDHPTID